MRHLVPRENSAEVDELNGDTELLLSHVDGRLEHAHLSTPANHYEKSKQEFQLFQGGKGSTSEVSALLDDARLAKGNLVVTHGNLLNSRAVDTLTPLNQKNLSLKQT